MITQTQIESWRDRMEVLAREIEDAQKKTVDTGLRRELRTIVEDLDTSAQSLHTLPEAEPPYAEIERES